MKKEHLIKELRKALSRDDLAREAGVSNFTITKYARKTITALGKKIIELRRQNKSVREITDILGCSKSTVSSYCILVENNDKIRRALSQKRLKERKEEAFLSTESKWIKRHRRRMTFNYQMCHHYHKEALIKLLGSKCMRCGAEHRAGSIHFHHTDPKSKKFSVSSKTRRPLQEILEEVSKCSMVCSNCHNEIHFDNLNAPNCRLISVEEYQKSLIRVREIRIKEINRKTLDKFCEKVHYLGASGKGHVHCFGFFTDSELVGVALITNPTREESKINGEPTLELTRFLILGRYRWKNVASKCLSLIIKELKKTSYKHLITFVDTGHHIGTIYKAANFVECGKTKASYNYDGIHKKTIYERAKKYGMSEHEYAELFQLTRRREEPKIKFRYSL